jgi:ABC-type thiamine transport system substrate-binding protein
MIRDKFIAVIAITCACFAVSSLNAATIPAGTTLTVRTVSSISSTDRVGRTFAAQIDQDVAVNGKVLLRAGTKAVVRIQSSQAIPRASKPLTLDLTSISVNGRDVAVKTDSFEPGSPKTVRGRRAGQISIGTFVVQPRSKMRFQLTQAIML